MSVIIFAATWLAPGIASAQEKVRLGVLPFSESLAAIIADKKGFFKEEGLDVDISKFDSGAIAVPVLQERGWMPWYSRRALSCVRRRLIPRPR
jgi:NitT/TauT family transport system substrate-binding protein